METNTDSVCNWIKVKRKLQRERIVGKKITIQLFKEDNKQISAKLNVIYDKNTENVIIGHGLYYMGNTYHPTTYEKLKCINQHAIELYEKSLDYGRTKVKYKNISFRFGKHIRLSTCIVYNINTNNIKINDIIYYKTKYITR